jgi:hypothetical protein
MRSVRQSLGHAHGVLLLSRITCQDVRGPDGRVIGRVADLTVSLGEQDGPTLVDRLLVRRQAAADLLVPWTEVGSFQCTEVVLAHTATGSLELVGVEVGIAGVLRRLGLHRLARRAREDAVAWTDLHLTSERGHDVQLATPRSAVHHLDARGLAVLVSRLDTESAAEVLAAKGPGVAADVVRASHPVVGERVLRAMPDTTTADIVAAMPANHATQWRSRLAHTPALRGRRFLRSHVWPRRRHTPRPKAGA